MASEIVAAVTCVAEFTVAPIVKQVKYVLDYKQNMTKLPKEVEKLVDLKQEVESLVSSARRNAEAIKPSAEAWMEEADETAVAARQMVREEEEESKKRCFVGLCPNPVSRHRSSRKAFKETVQILQLQTAGREFKEGSVSFPLSAVPSFPLTVTLDKDFLDFSSRSETFEDIMKAFKDPDSNVIGVYGMGGLGKTTLIKQVATRAVEEKLFDEVVMPVVTQKNVLDVQEFQGEMAKVLGLKLDDQLNVSQRADRIFKRLTGDEKMEKKTIVILDDLRTKLDLEQVGIPFGVGTKGCKILFTSRFQYISYAGQKVFTLGVLEEKEAWRLFQKITCDVLEDPAFFNIGKNVTKNCKGLPILIVTVAGTLLQRRSLGAWKDALINLEHEGSKEMQEFVDSALEFISFNHLPPANKSLFLLCGLLGGGEISIFDQLLILGIGRGLFKHTKTVEEARNNLETLIHDLKASFLLLDGQSVDSVRMHDVVRDVAIKIASNEDHNMLLGSSEEWPKDDMLNRCTALTFPYGIVPPLPECLASPSLEFLLLYHNSSSLKITDNLFEKMQKLTILDMRSIDLFPKLPSSVAFLENLHTLSLNLCKLRDISIVGALKKLEILRLNSTDIEELPMEIGKLSKLRVLDLNSCSKLKVIPPGVVQRLSRLEELDMANSFSQWEVEGLTSSERRNASLDELKYLVNLTTLRMRVPDAKLLPQDFSFKKLERFTILIGYEYWDCRDEQSFYKFRGIKMKVNDNGNIYLEAGVQEMLKRTEILQLDGMENIHELEWKNFQELKFVRISRSAETRYIVNAMEHQTPDRAFPVVLESLFLYDLPQLQYLCRGMVMATSSSFSKLKNVEVCDCYSLKSLFSFCMARGLPHLEEIQVNNCKSLEAIVEDTSEDATNGGTVIDKFEFRQLRSVSLKHLPKLASFCNNVTRDDMESKDGCTVIEPFFSDKVLFPKLERLELYRCDGMEYLFNQSIVTGIEQLNSIRIQNCQSLKGIVAKVEGEETNETIEFPQLVNLFLHELPCLTRFCSGCSIAFPTLTMLDMGDCEQFKTFVWADTVREDKTMTSLFNEKVELPNLKTLKLQWLDNVEAIWHDHLHQDSFFKLEQVHIYDCQNLLKIFPCTMLRRIQSLEELRLRNICLAEEVFENDEMAKPNISQGGETTHDKITFPQLRVLTLWRMSNLKRFCSGSCVVFPVLTNLCIQGCTQIETFMYPITVSNSKRQGVEDVDSNDKQLLFNEKVELPSLKRLDLRKLNNIKIIWDSRIHEDSFSTLEEVIIDECANLLRIFPSAMLGRIQRLKKLWILESCSVEEIFEAPTKIIDIMVSDLFLNNLPELKCIWREDLVRSLSFRYLRKVNVRHCQGLEYLFPASGAKQLHHLEQLRVSDCGLETIVCHHKEEEVTEEATAFVLPRLVTLYLVGLPKLESFYPGGHTAQWPSMKELVLERTFPSDLGKLADYGGDSFLTPILKKIESLQVSDCPGLARIVQGLVSFKFLTELQVSNYDGLVQFSTARSLVQLTTLKVTKCKAMKEIVASESEDGAEEEIVFSKLKTLELGELPDLVNFYLGNCILKFPLLEEVTLIWCKNMNAFCGGITITPKLKRLSLDWKKMDFEGDEDDKDLNTIIKEARRLVTEHATGVLKRFYEAQDDICRNGNEPGTNTGIVVEPGKKTEISMVLVKQDGSAETCEDVGEEVAEMTDKAIMPSVEGESSEQAIPFKKNDETCENIIEPTKDVHNHENEAINSRKEAYKVDDERVELCEKIVEPKEDIDTCKETDKARNEDQALPRPSVLKETQGSHAPIPDTVGERVELRKEGELCVKSVEPREEIDTCKARNEAETLQRPYLVKETQGSGAPTPDIVDVTCPSSQSHQTCQQRKDFQGLQVAQHLVELLEKAQDKHGAFHISPSIKLKRTRISAMETVGEVLHILQTQPPRSIDAEKIQFMEDAIHDLSIMSFPIEWLRPVIDKAKKCLLCLERKKKIDEMEAQMQLLKREMEMEKALFDQEIGFTVDYDRPLLDN